MFILAWQLYGEMLYWLMRMEGRVQHIHFLFQNCQKMSISTVLYVQYGAGMMGNLLDNAGGLNIKNS